VKSSFERRQTVSFILTAVNFPHPQRDKAATEEQNCNLDVYYADRAALNGGRC